MLKPRRKAEPVGLTIVREEETGIPRRVLLSTIDLPYNYLELKASPEEARVQGTIMLPDVYVQTEIVPAEAFAPAPPTANDELIAKLYDTIEVLLDEIADAGKELVSITIERNGDAKVLTLKTGEVF